MTDELYKFILDKQHHKFRKHVDIEFDRSQSPIERMTYRFETLCRAEQAHILDGELICFLRTVENIPDIFSADEWEDIRTEHFKHELGYMSNFSPDYEGVIAKGLLECRKDADEYGKRCIDAIIDLADRYKKEALNKGRTDIVKVLERVPKYGAQSFREALQFFRILHFSLWLEGDYHNTVGRFDKYMYPYFKHDMDNGILDRESAFELICDFFLSFNKDSDTYVGVQQGDNGQSMVLGGIDENGNEVFSLLSELCLEASGKLLMIDPKINLRVGKNTPIEIYEKASRLTKAGLGFPQYSNDDVVIPALEKMGYEHDDAANYVVAACWEFIIPKVGAEVANVGALSFPKVVDVAMHNSLASSKSFDEFVGHINEEIKRQCDAICSETKNLWFVPSPFMNVMMDCDVYNGGKYNNCGVHGTGVSTATDSLYAIKKYVFDEKRISAVELIKAVDEDFENSPELLSLLRYETPKMGQDNDEVDSISCDLLLEFSKALEGRVNCRGGIYRAGTGSAMFYLWHADEIGASPDGRRKGEPFGTNFSPSLFAKINGPFSVVKSFTKQDFSRTINGGPLTMEFHSSMFSDPDSIRKVAMLVKSFIERGGHQLQLNAVNLEKLKDAQVHPEKYRQLVVRIWGWSAYFVELDKRYQDHVMRRQEYSV